MQIPIEILGSIALAVLAASIIFGVFRAALFVGSKALKVRPLRKFKAWRKRRNARAVVQLKAKNAELSKTARIALAENERLILAAERRSVKIAHIKNCMEAI